MKPEPTYDEVLMHLVDINVYMGLVNAFFCGLLLTLVWRTRIRKKSPVPPDYDEPFGVDEVWEPFPKALLLLAQTPIYTRSQGFRTLNDMMALSLDYINSGLFMVMNTDENFSIGLVLINNVWNDAWKELPEDRRFFGFDAFLLFYSNAHDGHSINPETDPALQ